MFGGHVLPFFFLLLLFASLGHFLSSGSRLPYPLILVLLGYVGGELATRGLGLDTGVDWHSFYDLVYFGLIPALVFHGGTVIDAKALRADIWAIMFLAIPLMMLAAVITGALIYWGIGDPGHFPWMAALLGGVLMSATDPSAVIAALKNSGVPKRILVLLEGESLFNDAAAVVLFSVLLRFALGGPGTEDWSWARGALELGRVFFGGIAVGVVSSLVLYSLLRVVRDAESQMLLTVVCVWGGFFVAEKYLHMSGVMAALVVGLVMGRIAYGESEGSARGDLVDRAYIQGSWRFIVHLCESLIFLMGGVTITAGMFINQWLAILIAIFAILAARFLILFLPFAVFCRLPRQQKLGCRQQCLLAWGGVRGTMTLALALSLPVALESWYTVQAMAYGVVVYTLFVQVLTLPFVLRMLGLSASVDERGG